MNGVTQIATVAQGVIDIIAVGEQVVTEIYQAAANAMDAAEKEKESGADKKAWVIAWVKSFVIDSGEKWSVWENLIITFIEKIKAAYNAVRSLFD